MAWNRLEKCCPSVSSDIRNDENILLIKLIREKKLKQKKWKKKKKKKKT